MVMYRIYTIGPDGRFASIEVAECADDKEVVEKALPQANGFGIEIWDHKRFVVRLPGNAPVVPNQIRDAAEHWRERAAQMRALALTMDNPEAKALMEDLALEYDTLADKGVKTDGKGRRK